MAQNFRRYAEKNIGTTPVDIPDGANFDSFDTIVGINLANRSALAIKASVYILINGATDNETNRHYYIKDAPIPTGGSLELIDGGSKVVLQTGDSVEAYASAASSVDIITSVVDTISA